MDIMSGIKSIFSAGVGKVVDSVGSAIDRNVTSDEERLKLKNELIEIQAKAELEGERLSNNLEQEFTKRHALDMQSDDKLSKRIRPLSLIYLLLFETILALTDGNIHIDDYVFSIKPEHVSLIEVLLVSVFTFYFGSRGAEKLLKIWKGSPETVQK